MSTFPFKVPANTRVIVQQPANSSDLTSWLLNMICEGEPVIAVDCQLDEPLVFQGGSNVINLTIPKDCKVTIVVEKVQP